MKLTDAQILDAWARFRDMPQDQALLDLAHWANEQGQLPDPRRERAWREYCRVMGYGERVDLPQVRHILDLVFDAYEATE